MTENEARARIIDHFDVHHHDNRPHPLLHEAVGMAIKALEEVQQYRTIGTPEELQDMKNNYFEALSDWRQYRKIGTLEECRAAMETQIDEKPTAVLGNFGGTDYECKNCGNNVCYGDEYCRWCGQKLDWSDGDDGN